MAQSGGKGKGRRAPKARPGAKDNTLGRGPTAIPPGSPAPHREETVEGARREMEKPLGKLKSPGRP